MISLFDTPVSAGKSLYSASVERVSLGEERFTKHAVFHGEVDDKDGEYFCAALMRDSRRSTKKITRCTLITIDADNLTPRQDEKIMFLLGETSLEYIVYTTTRHTPDNPRRRLVFRPSRPMTVEEYRHVTRKICEQFAIDEPDKVSFVPASPMLYPLCLAGNEAEANITVSAGEAVDVDAFLKDQVLASEEDEPDPSTMLPMPIPGALSSAAWYQSVLTAYPANTCDYHQWLMIGMAMYHQTFGKQFDLWYQWSKLNTEKHGREFGREKMYTKWVSFKDDPETRGVTLRKVLNEETFRRQKVLSLAYARFMDSVTEPADLQRLQTDIQDDKYLHSDKDYKPIAKAYVKAIKRCFDEKISVGDASVALKPEHAIGGIKQYFYNNYLFRARDTMYVSIKDRNELPRESMNFRYGSKMPHSNTGTRKLVHKVLTEESNGYVKPREMHGFTYVIHGERIIENEGRVYLNLFNPDSWPESLTKFNRDNAIDNEVRGMILKHMRLLGNNDRTLIELLIKHLGHLRQRPNQRVHWAYAISSLFQGVGKSTLQRIYRIVLGDEQINTLSSNDIIEKYNQFASAPKLMSFIEEFEYTSTRERNMAIKNMKDYITSDVVSVRRMTVAAHAELAHTAYALFSNDEYVLGHESVGRRWVPMIVQAMNSEQCAEILGEEHTEFYRRYHKMMDDYPERFVAYFDQVSLTGFNTEKPPRVASPIMFHENTPHARVTRVLHELIEEQRSVSITADWVGAGAALKLLENEVNMGDSSDVEELRHFKPTQMRHLLTVALRNMGYKIAHNSKDRVRVGFPEKERCFMNEIWIKSSRRYGGPVGIERLKQRVKREVNQRQQRALPDPVDDDDNDNLDMDNLDF